MTRRLIDGSDDQHVDDDELLSRERSHEREYQRLWGRARQELQTTFRVLPKGGLLVSAWERWTNTRIVARLRGLTLPK